jgi:flagellar basal-body rod protein FlgB
METDRLKLLTNAMQTYVWRLKALTSNIANLDTPGYQRLSVSFEEKLQEVRHALPGLRDTTEIVPSMKVDDSPPVIEDEMMNLADTQMRTQFSTRALHEHFEVMRSAIMGRSA